MDDRPPPAQTDTASPPTRDALRAAFIARLTASATHELRNVLAIVKESSGLVADLVAAAAPGGGPSPEQTGRALERIQRQVARGAELATSLNRIMHGLDHDEERVELADALRHGSRLTLRFAQQRGREIEVEAGAEETDGLTVRANALDLYMGLVTVMEACLDAIPEGSALVVRPERRDDRATVALRVRPPGGDLSDVAANAPAAVRTELAGLSARLEGAAGEGPLLLVFAGTEEAR